MPKIADLFVALRVEGAGKFSAAIQSAKDNVQKAQAALAKGLTGGLQSKLNSFVLAKFGDKKLPTETKELDKAFENMGRSIKSLSDKAKVAFVGLSALTIGAVSQGDWRGYQDFTISLKLLGMQMGVILAPILRKVTNMLMGLAEWLGNLSPAGQKTIMVLTAVGLAFTFLGGYVMKAASAIGLMNLALIGLIALAGKLVKDLAWGGDIEQKRDKELWRIRAGVLRTDEINQAKPMIEGKSKDEQLEALRQRQADLMAQHHATTQAKFDLNLDKRERNAAEGKLAGSLFGAGWSEESSTKVGKAKELIEQQAALQVQIEANKVLYDQLKGGKSLSEISKSAAEREKNNPTGKGSVAKSAYDNYVEQNRKGYQFMGIADAWKNAMQSTVETPELREMQKIYEALRKEFDKPKPAPVRPMGSTA